MSSRGEDWIGVSLSRGRYLVSERLGEGGMAVVYKGVDRTLETDVVIKVPKPHLSADPNFAGRFAAEVRSLVKLTHPAVVKVTDAGTHDGLPFAVMQYLPGGSLEDRVANVSVRGSALELLRGWLPSIASALDYVHSQGYVHRDVKPGNILFDAIGHPLLGDFGIAKALYDSTSQNHEPRAMTRGVLVLGTPEYMSPELVMGQPFDGRADQYALAITVYEVVSGIVPFQATTPSAVFVLQSTHEPSPLDRAVPGVSPELAAAVARGMAKDPLARFPNCASFARTVLMAARGTATVVSPNPRPSKPSQSPGYSDKTSFQCPYCERSFAAQLNPAAPGMVDNDRVVICPGCGNRVTGKRAGTVVETALPAMDVGRGPAQRATIVSSRSPSLAPKPTIVERPVGSRSISSPTVASGSREIILTAPPPTVTAPSDVVSRSSGVSSRVLLIGSALSLAVIIGIYASSNMLFKGTRAAPEHVVTGPMPEKKLGVQRKIDPPPAPVPGTLVLDISDVPTDSEAFLDEIQQSLDALRSPLKLAPGTHTLLVTAKGYKAFRREFEIKDGKALWLQVTLTRIAVVEPPRFPQRPPEIPNQGGIPGRGVPAMPAPGVDTPRATFEPIAKGQVVDTITLAELKDYQAKYNGREVVPTGFFILGRQGQLNPDGTGSLAVCQVSLVARVNGLASLRVMNPPTSVDIHPDLAGALMKFGIVAFGPQRVEPSGDLKRDFLDNPAILTLHVQKKPGEQEEVWVPLVKEVEFLVEMHFWRIGERKFKDSFRTFTVAGEEILGPRMSHRTDWSIRLGASYIGQLRNIVANMKNQRFNEKMHQLDTMILRGVDRAIQNSTNPADALDKRFRQSFGP